MKRAALRKLRTLKIVYSLLFKECTKAHYNTFDNKFTLRTDGDIRFIKITFNGNFIINGLLPEGYSAVLGKNFIKISNRVGRKLPTSNILFSYRGVLLTKRVIITDWQRNKVRVTQEASLNTDIMAANRTNFEDDTQIISEVFQYRIASLRKTPEIKTNITTGLYTNNTFPNGYSGYVHHYPEENIYMTGRFPSSESKLLAHKSQLKNPRFKSNFSKLTKKMGKINSLKLFLDTTPTGKIINQVKEKPIDALSYKLSAGKAQLKTTKAARATTKGGTRTTIKKGGGY